MHEVTVKFPTIWSDSRELSDRDRLDRMRFGYDVAQDDRQRISAAFKSRTKAPVRKAVQPIVRLAYYRQRKIGLFAKVPFDIATDHVGDLAEGISDIRLGQ